MLCYASSNMTWINLLEAITASRFTSSCARRNANEQHRHWGSGSYQISITGDYLKYYWGVGVRPRNKDNLYLRVVKINVLWESKYSKQYVDQKIPRFSCLKRGMEKPYDGARCICYWLTTSSNTGDVLVA